MPDIFVAALKDKETAQNEDVKVVKSSDLEDDYAPVVDNKIHLFSSFCENPQDISFEDMEENEKILLFIRRSRILNLKWVFAASALIAAPFVVIPLMNLTHVFTAFPLKFHIFFLSFYYLAIATYIYVNFITWYFNLVLITNLRVIDIDFAGLIYKNVSTTKLSLVQDVSFHQIGVVRNMLDYGEVEIQTAGASENFVFEASPNPKRAVQIIEALIGK